MQITILKAQYDALGQTLAALDFAGDHETLALEMRRSLELERQIVATAIASAAEAVILCELIAVLVAEDDTEAAQVASETLGSWLRAEAAQSTAQS